MKHTGIGRRSFLAGVGLVAAAPATAQAAPARDEARWQTCLGLARDLLLVGPDGQDLKLEYLKVLIDSGLPKAAEPKKVLVVGAGIAGLVTGLLLKQAGHQVTIIEANGNRAGGRIKTFRQGPEHPRQARAVRRPAPVRGSRGHAPA